MLTLLYIILAIDILLIIFSFIMLFSTSALYAILFAVIALLGLVPIFVLINHIESIEELKTNFEKLQSEVKRLTDARNGGSPPKESSAPVIVKGESARAIWECVKCGTVNKAGTDHCVSCGAEYSPWINPTDSADQKKKLSRWVK